MAPPVRTLAALLLLAAARAVEDDGPDPGWELFVTYGGPAVPRTCYAAPRLPEFARGAYFVSGPALFELGGYAFQSIFDGLGKINRFELRDKQICYTSAWLGTGMYNSSMKAGAVTRGVLFENTKPERPPCPVLLPMCNLLAPNDNNWVSMIPMGSGEAALLSDTYEMVAMDLQSLSVKGIRPWGDDRISNAGQRVAGLNTPKWIQALHQPVSSSAHPLKRPGTSTWVHVLTEAPMVQGNSFVDVYTFEGESSSPLQERTLLTRIETVGSNQYFHSYGVTPNYVVLPFNLHMDMPSLVGTPILLGAFKQSWKGIHVVDVEGRAQVFHTEPFFHVHIVNCFENETGIVLDTGIYDGVPFEKAAYIDRQMFLNKTIRDSAKNRPGIRRLHLHLTGENAGMTTAEDLVPQGERSRDFFKINPAYSGLPYCIYYATEWWHDDKNFASMAILKHNVCTGTKTYWKRPDTYPGEPFFVERGGSKIEDDGLLVFVAIDGKKRRSLFVTLDGRTMREVEVVELPGHIPFTAHGQFFPADAGGERREEALFV
mmetsp:Transcript_42795/g.126781  ORF Transcript_42795/g.126781 Transcript_42795/m.126781 type:complete len:543 (+) Transcript_42795:58-1686(+)